jgi:hypothetical protein
VSVRAPQSLLGPPLRLTYDEEAKTLINPSWMSALGQKQTCAPQKVMSALPPIATAKADFPQTVMSALPQKADICGATSDVC